MFQSLRSFALAVALTGSISVAAPSAHAIPLLQTVDFTPAGTASPQVGFQAFDPSLGTLNSAVLEIFGTISASITTARSVVGGQPIPYAFTARVNQSFSGLGSLSQFGFSAPAQFLASNLPASGAGETLTVQLPFSYTMSFTDTSDLTGLAGLSTSGVTIPPPSVGGTLRMFIGGAAPSAALILAQTELPRIVVPDLEISSLFGTAVMAGGARLTFDYTAAITPPPPSPQPIPEPPMLWLAAIASAAGLAAQRRIARRA